MVLLLASDVSYLGYWLLQFSCWLSKESYKAKVKIVYVLYFDFAENSFSPNFYLATLGNLLLDIQSAIK